MGLSRGHTCPAKPETSIPTIIAIPLKKASEFLRLNNIDFLDIHFEYSSKNLMHLGLVDKIVDLFHRHPFLLDFNQFETLSEADRFCARIESLLYHSQLTEALLCRDPFYLP